MEQSQDRSKGVVNVQDSFFYALRREGKPIHVYLLTGKRVTGILRRFDRYALVVESHGLENLIYKHSVATVCLARGGDGEHLAPGAD
ncbi:MAG: RNA chaperone Hfq [Thermoanaerobaculaceae bacterium]|nr:RNA chaperone Hfq [Thermoanaerobaculaceae bacterium]MDI9622227.1 RNA chaperone Hfq [Acidobacteriota bacterium]NLH10541.1 RNA chaperone Hfq [Holophagae bacterium]HPW56851.1 RNA chaperone Hfq [Thermoanaerobaculaceae bacterium]